MGRGRPRKEEEVDETSSSHFKHLKKLADEAKEVKIRSEENVVVEKTIETVYDTRGKAKKRLVLRTANGNKYSKPYFD